MDPNEFLTYKKFSYKNQATALTDLLIANEIETLFEDTSAVFDLTFANNELNKEFRVKLKKQDFDKADKLLLSLSADQLNEVDADYYLFEFSDDELMEVLTKSEEWSEFNYLLAQKILRDRGKEVNKTLLETLRKQRNEELAKPYEDQESWIIAGYVFSFLGGLPGILIGWSLLSHKNTLPSGESVYAYSVEDRKHGKIILILGTILFVIWTIVIIG